jgi:CheY-specific phosphatase CheX
MSPSHDDVLKEVFTEVAERLAFVFASEVDEDHASAGTAAHLEATMTFSGPTEGRLRLVVPRDLAREMAANILGLDDDDTAVESRTYDALGEVLNVTCGHLLTRLHGEEPVFEMTVPQVRTLEPGGWQQLLERPGTQVLRIDERFVLLQLRQSTP